MTLAHLQAIVAAHDDYMHRDGQAVNAEGHVGVAAEAAGQNLKGSHRPFQGAAQSLSPHEGCLHIAQAGKLPLTAQAQKMRKAGPVHSTGKSCMLSLCCLWAARAMCRVMTRHHYAAAARAVQCQTGTRGTLFSSM